LLYSCARFVEGSGLPFTWGGFPLMLFKCCITLQTLITLLDTFSKLLYKCEHKTKLNEKETEGTRIAPHSAVDLAQLILWLKCHPNHFHIQ
jgi:hypothetical protein